MKNTGNVKLRTTIQDFFSSLKNRVIFTLIILSTSSFITAQERQPETGFQFANSYTTGSLDSVNINNGNLLVNLPIASLPKGQGTSPGFTVTLQYNSKLWNSKQTFHTNRILGGNQDQNPDDYYSYTEDKLQPSERGGWKMLSSYRIIETDRLNLEDPKPCLNGDPVEKLSARWKMEIEFPDGSVKQFIPIQYSASLDGYYDVDSNGRGTTVRLEQNPATGVCYERYFESSGNSGNYITTDGSRLRLFIPYQPNVGIGGRNWKVYAPDGTVIENAPPDDPTTFQRITERNGGFVKIKGGQIVDQLGRSIEIDYDHVTVNGVGGEPLTTQFTYSDTFVRRKYRSITNQQQVPLGTELYDVMNYPFSNIQQVKLPKQSGGQTYNFEYNGAAAQPSETDYTSGWGEMKSITFPSGAKANYSYDTLDGIELTPEEVVRDGVRQKDLEFTEVYDGVSTPRTETSSYSSDPSSGYMVGPDGRGSAEYFYNNTQVAAWNNGLAYRTVSPGVITERVWKQNLVNYVGNPNRYPYQIYIIPNSNAYVKTEFSSLVDRTGQRALTAIKDFNYDKNGNVTKIVEYDWVPQGDIRRENNYPEGKPTGEIPASARVKRITVNGYYNQTPDASSSEISPYTYQNPNSPKLKNVIKFTEVQTAAGVPVSRSEFYYDDPNTTGNLIETRTWDSTKQAVLQAANSSGYKLVNNNFVKSSATYDQYGNQITSTDANGVTNTITYGDINGFTGLYPTKTEAASNYASLKRTSTAAYDFYTGAVTSVTDVDNNVTNETSYDAIGRAILSKAAVGTTLESWTQSEYEDELRRVIIRSDLETVGDGKKIAIQHYDQLGRVRLTRTLENPATEDPTDEQQGIKIQTRYRADNPYSYSLSSNPYRAETSTAAAKETTMGWTRSRSHFSGKESISETFSGAALPAPWGDNANTNTNTTGKTQSDLDVNVNIASGQAGTVTTVTDQAGKQRRSITNVFGQTIRVDEPDKVTGSLDSGGSPVQPTNYRYSTIGKMIEVTQGVQQRHFLYDSLGRLLRLKQPEQEVNPALSLSNPEGNNIQWSVGFSYDNNGNVLTTTDAKNVTTTVAYDAINRAKTRSYSDGTTPAVNYTYDDPKIPFSKGQLTKVSSTISETRYTSFGPTGRLLESEQITDGRSFPSRYKYNLSGVMTEETYPSGRVVQNYLDADGDLAAIVSKTANGQFKNYASNMTYSAMKLLEQVQLGNGLWESGKVNSRGQATEFKLGTSPGDGSLWKLNYDYGEFDASGNVDATKNAGNIVKQTVSFNGLAKPFVQTYKYDALDRIKEAKEMSGTNQTWSQTFDYDRYGNRTAFSQNVLGQQLPINNQTLPAIDTNTNRFQTGPDYRYDANGNLVQDYGGRQFTFDADNKQTLVKDSSNNPVGQYFYDGNGNRVKKVTNTETVIFVYDSSQKLIAEYSTATPVQNPTVNYTATDPLGSPRVLTNKQGQIVSRRDFMPFGEEILADATYRTIGQKYGVIDNVRQKFTGYQRDDETQLDFAEARYYNDTHGRFTAVDPLLASGKSANPQTFNRYVYSLNRPLNHNDPTGLQTTERVNVEGYTYKPTGTKEVVTGYISNGQLPPTAITMTVETGKEQIVPTNNEVNEIMSDLATAVSDNDQKIGSAIYAAEEHDGVFTLDKVSLNVGLKIGKETSGEVGVGADFTVHNRNDLEKVRQQAEDLLVADAQKKLAAQPTRNSNSPDKEAPLNAGQIDGLAASSVRHGSEDAAVKLERRREIRKQAESGRDRQRAKERMREQQEMPPR